MARGIKTKELWQNPEYREHMRLVHLGQVAWNRGKSWSQEIKDKMSESKLGEHYSPETEFKKGIIPWNKGKEMTQGYKDTISKTLIGLTGELSRNWKGGFDSKEYSKKYSPIYYKANKKRILANAAIYSRNRRANDLIFKLTMNLRSRIKNAIKENRTEKAFSSIELLGTSIPKVREYLEKQFKPNMSWDNYGLYGWHIDHRIPLTHFNLIEPEEQKKAFHYTNLQPLWAEENLIKHTTYLI